VFVGGKSGDNVTLKVDFPCISPPFPDVWGVGESFKVQLHLTKNNHPFEGTLEVQFGDQKPMMLITDVNGIAEIELKTNIKGNYLVSAKYNPQSHNDLVAKRSLRIVDYVEEIVSIFKDTFEVQKAKGVQINQETTPREFQCALQQSFNLPDKEPLNEFVTIFEIADYSLYKLHRVDYEKMFLAALSVKEAPKKEARFD
jgi:hypothetical protein